MYGIDTRDERGLKEEHHHSAISKAKDLLHACMDKRFLEKTEKKHEHPAWTNNTVRRTR